MENIFNIFLSMSSNQNWYFFGHNITKSFQFFLEILRAVFLDFVHIPDINLTIIELKLVPRRETPSAIYVNDRYHEQWATLQNILTQAAAVHCVCLRFGWSVQNEVAVCSVEWVVHQSRTVDSWTANHTKRHLYPAIWNALCPFSGVVPVYKIQKQHAVWSMRFT